MPEPHTNAEEAALKLAWDFLEQWGAILSASDAVTRLPEFLTAAEGLRGQMPEGVVNG